MQETRVTIGDIFPKLPSEKHQEIEEFFNRYLDFVLRTYEHIKADPHRYEEFLSLTDLDSERTIGNKGRVFTSTQENTDV